MTSRVGVDWLTGPREPHNNRRERRIEHLVGSYVHLARSGQGRSLADQKKPAAEDALTWIRAIGTTEQVSVIIEFADPGSGNCERLPDAMRKTSASSTTCRSSRAGSGRCGPENLSPRLLLQTRLTRQELQEVHVAGQLSDGYSSSRSNSISISSLVTLVPFDPFE